MANNSKHDKAFNTAFLLGGVAGLAGAIELQDYHRSDAVPENQALVDVVRQPDEAKRDDDSIVSDYQARLRKRQDDKLNTNGSTSAHLFEDVGSFLGGGFLTVVGTAMALQLRDMKRKDEKYTDLANKQGKVRAPTTGPDGMPVFAVIEDKPKINKRPDGDGHAR